MATWKRLTSADGKRTLIDVNMDNVAYIFPTDKYTTLYFIGSGGDSALTTAVRETPDEIRKQHNF